MCDSVVLQHCAPTLAGMKTGSLFSHWFDNEEDLRCSLRQLNQKLVGKGLCALPLNYKDGHTLIYVYRPTQLQRDLGDVTANRLLTERGYHCNQPQQCILHLMERLAESAEFPHEIGLFLGYPPEDVSGFIENKAACAKCVGCWKVYGDEEAARKRFAKYEKCTAVYCDLWEKGRSMERMIVAG